MEKRKRRSFDTPQLHIVENLNINSNTEIQTTPLSVKMKNKMPALRGGGWRIC